VSTKGLSYEEWKEWRRLGIGGSDAAGVAGLSKYTSALRVFLQKVGNDYDIEQNESMRLGKDLEDYVASRFVENTGKKVRRRNAIFQHPKYDFILANIDREIVGENAGLECKVVQSRNYDKWEDDNIPTYIYIQCLHYMAVMGYGRMYLMPLILGREPTHRIIERDDEAIANLLAKEITFWKTHVEKNEAPAPDGSKDCDLIYKEMYNEPTSELDIHLEWKEWLPKADRHDELKELIEKFEKEYNSIRQEFKNVMGNNEIAYIDERKITWKADKNGKRTLRI
jgi:putative phage-type endonuclease